MSAEIRILEDELKEYKLQLDTVNSGLSADPDNEELKGLASDIQEAITLTQQAISELRGEEEPPASKQQPSQSSERRPESSQPEYKRSNDVAEDVQVVDFAVGDSVLAKWISGDKGFYPARVTSKTGSSTDPVYIVSFKSYATTETLKAKDLRPLSNNDNRKRKLDQTPGSGSSTDGTVITAPPNIDTDLAPRRENVLGADGLPKPTKVRKVKANKELEKSKNNWQNFSVKGKHKGHKSKESMFRTPDGINGKVGFIGSGQSMRKDAARTKHIYDNVAEEEL